MNNVKEEKEEENIYKYLANSDYFEMNSEMNLK